MLLKLPCSHLWDSVGLKEKAYEVGWSGNFPLIGPRFIRVVWIHVLHVFAIFVLEAEGGWEEASGGAVTCGFVVRRPAVSVL